jgi:hypothetical protein
MTGLKTLLDEAAAVTFTAPEIGTITREGDRRVRRRRGAAAVAGIAAAAVVGAGALLFLDGPGGKADIDPADPAVPPNVPAWATGSTLHTPERNIDLGRPIRGFVRTTAGIVFASDDRGVYSHTEGEPEKIGTITEELPRLVSDAEDTLVGWVDDTGTLVVVDQATGETVLERGPERSAMHPLDLDGRTVFWREGKTLYGLYLGNRPGRPDRDPVNYFIALENDPWAMGFVDGNQVRVRLDPSNVVTLQGVRAREVRTQAGRGELAGEFSPGTRWISLVGESVRVFDTRTGERVPLDIPPRVDSFGYEWLGADTLMVGVEQSDGYELRRCEMLAGTCEVVTEGVPLDGRSLADLTVFPGGDVLLMREQSEE